MKTFIWIGLAIILLSHVMMLLGPSPPSMRIPHAIANIVAAGIIWVSC